MTSTKFLFFILLLTLSGCSSLNKSQVSPPSDYSSPTTIEEIKYWSASGKILLSQNNKKQSGNFYWQQSDKDYQFVVSTILGIDVFSIKVFNGLTTIFANGEEYKGSDSEALLYHLTGQTIPLGYIGDWMLGRVNEESVVSLSKNEKGLTKHFIFATDNNLPTPNTWGVSYTKRSLVEQFLLPTNISIASTQSRIKLKINDWKIN